jgi:hypothetical protein
VASQEIEEDVSGQGGDQGNCEVVFGEDIGESPSQAAFLGDAGALEFSHEEIGIEQENNKGYFDQTP